MSYSSRIGSAVRHTPFQPASPVLSRVSRSSGCWSMPSCPDVSKVCPSHHPRRQTRGDLMELEDMAPSKCAAERHAGSNPAIPKMQGAVSLVRQLLGSHFLFFAKAESLFSSRSSTSQQSTCASSTRYSECAILMFF